MFQPRILVTFKEEESWIECCFLPQGFSPDFHNGWNEMMLYFLSAFIYNLLPVVICLLFEEQNVFSWKAGDAKGDRRMDHMLVLQNTPPNTFSNIPLIHGRWINKSFWYLLWPKWLTYSTFFVLRLVWTQNIPETMAFFKICLIMISCRNLISWKDIWPFVKTFLPFVLVWTPVIHFATFPPLLFPRLRGSGGLTLSSLSYKRRFPPSSLDIAPISELKCSLFLSNRSGEVGFDVIHACDNKK